jgi:hypothetical protein
MLALPNYQAAEETVQPSVIIRSRFLVVARMRGTTLSEYALSRGTQ